MFPIDFVEKIAIIGSYELSDKTLEELKNYRPTFRAMDENSEVFDLEDLRIIIRRLPISIEPIAEEELKDLKDELATRDCTYFKITYR
jgi:hypothetical protein